MNRIFKIALMVLVAMLCTSIIVAIGYFMMLLPFWWGISIISFILILFFTGIAIKIDRDANG